MPSTVITSVQIKSSNWRQELPNVEQICQLAAESVWQEVFASSKKVEATIVLADDALVKSLNFRFRNKNESTNVLSFAAEDNRHVPEEETPSLGDIFMAFETIKNEAPKNVSDHLSHLVIHGCLHLLGYNHETEGEAYAMETLEVKLLAGLGIKDPYCTSCA